MEREEIISRTNAFLIEDFEVEESALVPGADLKEALGLDSLDYIDLVVAIEQNFGFKVKPEDFTGIHTFEDFYDYIISRVQIKNVA